MARSSRLRDWQISTASFSRLLPDVMAFPHHIGYKQGQRGINWDTFDPTFAPVVEIISMHGCSESDEGPRPYLHSMGPSDHRGTMAYGLAQGHVFGVVGSTDHHSGHPGSYGHGRTGVWARDLTRGGLWEALRARRTYALTGDRIDVQFAVNGEPMGTVLGPAQRREVAFRVVGGGPLDCVDIIKNGALLRRFSQYDMAHPTVDADRIHTKLLLEVGWGARGVKVDWDVHLGVSGGRLLAVEPRFRGPEVVAPQEADPDADPNHHTSHWEPEGDSAIGFATVTHGNPNNLTPGTQGVCLEVEAPLDAVLWAQLNGHKERFTIRDLVEGARAGRLGKIDSPSYRFHRAPGWRELEWQATFEDLSSAGHRDDIYYLRVRQRNDQWAWSSPIWVRAH